MPYLLGSLVKEAIQTIATFKQCSGIRCYARKRASELRSHYVGEAAQVIVTTVGAASVSVSGSVIGNAEKCLFNPPKTYGRASLFVAGILLTSCSIIFTPAAPYCAS